VPEIDKIAVVIEENGGGGFLVIATIAGIEHLYSDFAILVGVPGGYCVTEVLERYPEAPVPKSIAIT
jgi:hypothetical protein